jgi:hypothetical protein
LGVERGAAHSRQAALDCFDVRFQIKQFLGPENAFKDIETATPVSLDNIGMERAIVREPNGATIAERHSARLSSLEISLHGCFVFTEVRAFGCMVHLDVAPADQQPLWSGVARFRKAFLCAVPEPCFWRDLALKWPVLPGLKAQMFARG